MSPSATIDAHEAAGRTWPAVVVGAGPAGAFAALQLARAGVRPLLLDGQAFPRAKVCGGCLNARTLALLGEAGLEQLPAELGGVALEYFALHAGGREVRLPMPGGIAVSRAALDTELVRRAISAGAHFLPETRATLGTVDAGFRWLMLPRSRHRLRAQWVVAAHGLGGNFLAGDSAHRATEAPDSRIGAGAVIENPTDFYLPGVLHMAVGRTGYVGITRVEGGGLGVAAALDRAALDRDGGLDGAIGRLLRESRLPLLGHAPRWRGTAPLSRRAPMAAFERVFLVGDAAGYIEPFTGEGISWALEGAREVADLLTRLPRGQASAAVESRWRRSHRRLIVRRQRWCRAVSWGLRRPSLVTSTAWLLDRTPALATPLLAHLNAAPEKRTA